MRICVGLAGLGERWHDPRGEVVETCSIITTTANEVVRPVHDRMPVIFDPTDYCQWPDPRTDADDLRALLRAFPRRS